MKVLNSLDRKVLALSTLGSASSVSLRHLVYIRTLAIRNPFELKPLTFSCISHHIPRPSGPQVINSIHKHSKFDADLNAFYISTVVK